MVSFLNAGNAVQTVNVQSCRKMDLLAREGHDYVDFASLLNDAGTTSTTAVAASDSGSHPSDGVELLRQLMQ